MEELPGQVVFGERRSRIGVSAAFAVVAVVLLVASGLGVLGGRPQATPAGSPDASGVAVAAPSPASPGPDRTPAVTPAEPCGPEPDGAPRVYLDVNGVSRRGDVEEDLPNSTPTPAGDGDGFPIPRLEIPTGAATEIWIDGDPCAVAWDIRLAAESGRRYPVSIFANAGRDPSIARQNHFALSFAENRGLTEDLVLEAGLDFEGGLGVLATWPIRLLPVIRPRAWLNDAASGRSIDLTEGCDVVMTLRNGDEQRPGCDRDLSSLPGPPTKVTTGTVLGLELEGWSVTDMVVNCGSQSDRVFSAAQAPGCIAASSGTSFTAPIRGDWTLAVAACAVGYTQFASNRICGTWYAAIDTR